MCGGDRNVASPAEGTRDGCGDRNVAAPAEGTRGGCGDRNVAAPAEGAEVGAATFLSPQPDASALSPQGELPPPRFFSREARVVKTANCLPHWEQSGCCCFVTWRTADSIPQERLTAIRAERELFDLQHPQPWDEAIWAEYYRLFEGRYQKWLDEGAGACLLRQERLRCAVEEVITRFDRSRYVVYAHIVMPNHVHVLFMPLGEHSIAEILKGWKGVSARAVNAATGASGSFWQKESWDHCVRSAAQFLKFMDYIRSNDPKIAYCAYGTEGRR